LQRFFSHHTAPAVAKRNATFQTNTPPVPQLVTDSGAKGHAHWCKRAWCGAKGHGAKGHAHQIYNWLMSH